MRAVPIAVRVTGLSKEYRVGALRGSIYDRASGWLGRGRPATVERSVWAIRDLTFEISQGQVLGVLGRNGSGKSTLLKLLARVTAPTTGSAELHGRVGALLSVGAGFHPELSGRDNVMLSGAILGMSKEETSAAFDAIVAFSGVEDFLDIPVKHYSSGMYLRLAFSVAAHLQADIMLLDEVMAVGDAAFTERSRERMRELVTGGRTIVYVSHSLPSVRMLCDLVVVLERGEQKFLGPAADAVRFYLEEIIQPLQLRSGAAG